MAAQIVWFKRDLRITDHRALDAALQAGPALGLYVFEPELLHTAASDPSHTAFMIQGLTELRRSFEDRGGLLLVRTGEVVETLAALHAELGGISHLWSHEETGNLLSYRRDQRVARWATEAGVPWTELWQHGVVRRLASRDGWSKVWNQRMDQRQAPTPEHIPVPDLLPEDLDIGRIPELTDLGLVANARTPGPDRSVQSGGELAAQEVLDSFLAGRGVNYRADMSTPVAGWDGCSRLSPYLAAGNISIRLVHQRTRLRAAELKEERARGVEIPKTFLPSLRSFGSRLRWHCHFMQKLEDQPELETQEMNRAYHGLRDDLHDDALLDAWYYGRTGYPMVDACMRCLHETGWINFRMRAMLVSFACHHLGQRWQDVADRLAPLFLDYECGIHYSQAQMQAGVTGINTVRIYSPAKQVKDQDPDGVFLKRWCQELEGVPKKHLPEPHTMDLTTQAAAGCEIGQDYPAPIVDHKTAYQAARDRIWSVRKTAEARAEAERVYEKHGSRKQPMARRRS